MELLEEAALVRKAQAGDQEALAELWDKITPKLFGYLVNATRDQSLAEDLLQSTWLRALEALARFKPRHNASFRAWLFAIARNECRQHWRKSQKEPIGIEMHPEPSEDTIAKDTTNLILEQVLNKLSKQDQELIRLRYIADLPLEAIARLLNLNFITVRVRLHRALHRARAHFNSDI